MTHTPLPPTAELWERFSYNPLTGTLHTRTRPNGRVKLDAPVGHINQHGYLTTTIKSGGKRRAYYVSRLVYRWTTGEDPATLTIDHINRVRTDNRAWNLRPATRSVQNYNREYAQDYYPNLNRH